MPAEADERDDFIRAQGLPFMAHLLRRISDHMVNEAGAWEDATFGIKAPPRTASTMLLLDQDGAQSVTQLAERLRQSHQLMVTWLKQLEALKFVKSAPDPDDARRSLAVLTPAGRAEARRMREASAMIGRAYSKLLREAHADPHMLEALWRVHDLLQRGRLADLLRMERR
ncbi:MAG: MarR family transcriptional regulator [Vitreimonas sp.]